MAPISQGGMIISAFYTRAQKASTQEGGEFLEPAVWVGSNPQTLNYSASDSNEALLLLKLRLKFLGALKKRETNLLIKI